MYKSPLIFVSKEGNVFFIWEFTQNSMPFHSWQQYEVYIGGHGTSGDQILVNGIVWKKSLNIWHMCKFTKINGGDDLQLW
jgi:hypothetical protein